MLENADYVILITKEKKKSTENEYITFKLLASRGKKMDLTYFAHPMQNGMRLEEDVTLSKSLSIADLGDDLANFDPNSPKSSEDGEVAPRRPRITPTSVKTTAMNSDEMIKNMKIEL